MAEISGTAKLPPSGDKHGEAGERLWVIFVTAVIVLLVAMVVYTSVHWGFHPPSQVETIDSTSLHKGGEFSEANLGTVIAPDGSALVRVVAQQYAFIPNCLVVPAGKPVTFRLASADVVHGFIVQGTNVNAMVVPGYVTTVRTTFRDPGEHLMPCHEFCGIGHQAMWARVRVVEPSSFPTDAAKQKAVNCAS
ncbi:MAG TPA: cytochrome C oxidase subunit II [Burkholderiales bacterium]|nr:cytochrome C oxidase subunit II [Burkholderiales bacterium]